VKKQTPQSQPQVLSTGLRRYLYFTAAMTGAAIMVVEILGAKMLAPYVGTSHFVWTAQIAVTLVALATGYYIGGSLVDRSPKLGTMYGSILAAAVYLCGTVVMVERVAFTCLDIGKLAMGSLLASAILYFVPLALLAMTGPFFIRIITVAVTGVGGNVGRLTAISTLGSFVGTILIGYVLIPFFRNSITMYLTAALLIGVAAGYFLVWGRQQHSIGGISAAIVAGLLVGYVGVDADAKKLYRMGREVYRANSNFGQLQVLESTDTSGRSIRYYLNDYLTQNGYLPQDKKSFYFFTYMLYGLGHGYRAEIKDVLCIGMGVGIVPMKFVNEGARVDVVEINPAVVPLAQKYFDLQPERFNLVIGDGRQFVNNTTKKYDAIMLDAFLGDASPSHLMTREAFESMRKALKPGGVLVINSFGDFDAGKDFFTASLDKTLKSVFQSVNIHYSEWHGNIFFAASDHKDFKILGPPDLSQVPEEMKEHVEEAFDGIRTTNSRSGIVMTDDFNPSEYYDADNRERVRRGLVSSLILGR
jgi:spermidine synthase